jgi:hypothetical protein
MQSLMVSQIETKAIPIANLQYIQVREYESAETIAEYKEAIEHGANFKAIDVFFDGSKYFVADGIHRCKAHHHAKRTEIEANVHLGDEFDALAFAVGANSDHGLRRTNKDKRNAIRMLLRCDRWKMMVPSELARQCQVSRGLVNEVESEAEFKWRETLEKVTELRDGKARERKKGNSPRKPKEIVEANQVVAVVAEDGHALATTPIKVVNHEGPQVAVKTEAPSVEGSLSKPANSAHKIDVVGRKLKEMIDLHLNAETVEPISESSRDMFIDLCRSIEHFIEQVPVSDDEVAS